MQKSTDGSFIDLIVNSTNQISDKRNLELWDRQHLVCEILKRIKKRFGYLPSSGIIAGQCVASACYEVVGVGSGPMRDLDIFVSEDVDMTENVTIYKNPKSLGGDFITFPSSPSFSDEVKLGHLRKGAYTITYSAIHSNFSDWNVIGCSNLDKLECKVIVSGFDMNLCSIAIDMSSNEIYWSESFQDFLYSNEIKVDRYITPIHTAIRLVKKCQDMPWLNVNMDFQMKNLQAARALGMLYETNGYLATQLITRETLLKREKELALISRFFTVRSVDLTFASSEQGSIITKTETLFTLDPFALNKNNSDIVNQVYAIYPRVESKIKNVDLYNFSAETIHLLLNKNVSSARNNDLELLLSSVNEYANTNLKPKNLLNDTSINICNLIMAKILKQRESLYKYTKNDIRRIISAMISHPLIFSYLDLSLCELSTIAKNMKFIDKKNINYVIGLFESSSDESRFFPNLSDPLFQNKIIESSRKFEESCKNQSFEPISSYLSLKDSIEDVDYFDLSSRLDFIKVGSIDRNCLAGYYSPCSLYRYVSIRCIHKTSGRKATAMYEIKIQKKSDNDDRFVVTAKLNQFLGYLNSKPSDDIANAFPLETETFLDDIPEEIKRLMISKKL